MLTHTANGDSRLSLWLRVREFAVPPSMIETAALRRTAGDWAGACAAAGVDVDLDLRSAAHAYGRQLAALVRADLRRLAPDLLRWHMPRIAPDGVLRPGLTVPLARYEVSGDGPGGVAGDDDVRDDDVGDIASHSVYLVVRTAPAWADAGQRMSLALWDGSRSAGGERRHPHPRPSRRYRLDLHRHLWDAGRSDELRVRSGADAGPSVDPPSAHEEVPGRAVDRWAAEAGILLRAEGRTSGRVRVRLGARRQVVLDVPAGGGPASVAAVTSPSTSRTLPTLPDAATWVPPDLELLRAGLIEAGRLHPLVASALVPDHRPAGPAPVADPPGQPRLVECRGVRHRIGLSDGVLAPLDHGPAELRREELLVALGGPPLPCLQAIDEAHRRPDCLTGVRERLDHGDTVGALAVVEGLLGPGAALRNGALRDVLESAARRRIAYGLYRADLYGPGPGRVLPGDARPRHHRARPRHSYAL